MQVGYKYKKRLSAYKPVLTFLLFSMFSVSLVITIIFGANVYNNIIENKQDSFSKTVALSYITTKIRSNDNANSIRVDEIDGNAAIVISEQLDGEVFETWIYTNNNNLCELFADKNADKVAQAGTEIIPLKSINAKLDKNKLTVTATDIKHRSAKTSIAIRSGVEQNV